MLATGVSSTRRQRQFQTGGHGPAGAEARLQLQIEKLERQLLETQKKGDLVEESRLCNNIGKKYEKLGEWRKALNFHHYDGQISMAAGDIDGHLVALFNMANVALSMGLIALAQNYLNDQLRMALKQQNMPRAFQAYKSLGNICLMESETLVAVEVLRQEKLTEAGIFFYRAHETLDNYQAIIDAGLLASSRRKELDHLRLELRMSDGKLCLLKKDYDTALSKLSLALEGFVDLQDQCLQFEALDLIGATYLKLGQPTLAVEKCYDQMLSIAKGLGDHQLEAEALYNLALGYRDLRDFDLSLDTLYLYKDRITSVDNLDRVRLDEVDTTIKETLQLRDIAKSIEKTEAKLPTMKQPEKQYLKLAQDCHKLGLFEDALKYVKKKIDTLPDLESFRLIAELYLLLDHPDDAVYYAKIDLEGRQRMEREDEQDILQSYLLLAKAYWALPTLPGEVLRVLRDAKEIAMRERAPEKVLLEISSLLSLCHRRLNMDEEYLQIKEECKRINDRESKDDSGQTNLIMNELLETDYFHGRKASKNVMKLVDGQFNMISRTKGTKGLQIKRARRRADGEDVEASRPRSRSKLLTNKKKKNLITLDDEEDDLKDFIVNDDEEQDHHDGSVDSKAKKKSKGLTKKEYPILDDRFERYSHDHDDLLPGPIWPPSPKKVDFALMEARTDGEDNQAEKRGGAPSIDSGSKRTWSNDPACIASVLRLTVDVDNESFLIPVIDDIAERKTIAWLMNEIVLRYQNEFDKTPVLEALFTESGARLTHSDPIAMILVDGERLRAKVSGFRGKAFGQLYLDECSRCQVLPLNELVQRIKEWPEGAIDLSPWIYDDDHFELVMRALGKFDQTNRILELNLSNNHLITEQCLEVLATLTLTSTIHVLNLSFTTLTNAIVLLPFISKSLLELDISFCPVGDLSDFIYRISRMDPPLKRLYLNGHSLTNVPRLRDLSYLPSLESLSMTFCSFDESSLESVGMLVGSSVTLKELDLTGCQLRSLFLVEKINANVGLEKVTILEGNHFRRNDFQRLHINCIIE